MLNKCLTILTSFWLSSFFLLFELSRFEVTESINTAFSFVIPLDVDLGEHAADLLSLHKLFNHDLILLVGYSWCSYLVFFLVFDGNGF